jgi:hypothetical protein
MPLADGTRIFRIDHTGSFTILDNSLLTDARLSWEARGLLAYLLSKPDTWGVRSYDLERNGPAGKQKIRRLLKELVEAGYMLREPTKLSDGTFTWRTLVFEVSLEDPRSSELAAEADAVDAHSGM